ncbi:MAG TPA: hypothetical protein PLN42_11050, partial [Anaerolineae bacterium]|nr:hypothetical protein [Anaerolineae bacterium]
MITTRLAAAILWVGSVAASHALVPADAREMIAPIILDVPFISQREQNCGQCGDMENCGSASLAMVLQPYGCGLAASSPAALVHTMRKLMTGKENQCGQGGTDFDQMASAIRRLPASVPGRCRN